MKKNEFFFILTYAVRKKNLYLKMFVGDPTTRSLSSSQELIKSYARDYTEWILYN